ncbi:hypothetical protein TRFO_01930 [Tritrichomonas foetus]|uniref:Uncharacterized protein n=1 Tax=Tritrichomonas foetus TaxID=1144522 RepID=A0A1J4JKC7_9EUKA|nr:hypothetical protein TRFO_01930 [Tritrichomonas foetus]|eukprot:OHS98847.1 hypothetical protein TRFO_01930 [Tritrichomonas foetus]
MITFSRKAVISKKKILNGKIYSIFFMEETDEREALLDEISHTNLIPSLKSQIKKTVRDILKNHAQIEPKRPVTETSELANNIILEFLFSNGFHNTASVFYTESNVHQMARPQILEGLQINDNPGLIAELLLTKISHPSVSIQTESMDLNSKLQAIDREIKRKKEEGRIISSEEMLRRGIEDLDREYEERFNKELAHRLDVFRASELATSASQDAARRSAELQRIHQEMESELKQKTADLRAKFQRDADILRIRQRELEREIGKWAEQNVQKVATEAEISEAHKIKADAEKKAQKIEAKAMLLERKLEKDRRKLEDIQLEHNKAKREVEKLKMALALAQKRK